MVQTKKRRYANVTRVKQLQAGIAYIRMQKQISNSERLVRYMNREHNISKTETEKHLHYAVKDNLIMSYTGVGFKGSMTGVEYEGFRVPDPEERENDDDDHDWYCFECHTPGEVAACSECWRVFHSTCTEEYLDDNKFVCTICQAGRKKNKTKRKLLNTLLSYTILRLREKTRELHKIGHSEEEKKYTPFFIYKPMDLNTMEGKVQNNKYRCVEEFLADARLILHNVFLIYGDENDGYTELARVMIRDCKYDIEEMKQCKGCYYMSNAKPKDWFCQPCDPPHELVYAKLKGYSYWPAKVIRKLEDEKYDVRFFGSLHQRALIPKDQLKPIDVTPKELNAKKTAGFVKACQELKLHRKILEDREKEEDDDEEEEEEEEIEEPPKRKKKKHERKEDEEEERVEEEKVEEEERVEEEEEEVPKKKKRKYKKKQKKEELEDEEKENEEDNQVEEEEVEPPKKKKRKYEKKVKNEEEVEEKDVNKEEEEETQDDEEEEEEGSGVKDMDTLEVSSTSVNSPKRTSQKVSSPEDANIVTSSEEYVQTPKTKVSTASIGVQTSKKLTSNPTKAQGCQTETETEKKCDCEEKFNKVFADFKERIEKDHKESKEKALKEQAERLQKDFEDDKAQAVSRAMGKVNQELDKVRRQTEDKCREQYMTEMKSLAQKHKETISQTKKKQWCFNCEEEAMYHCCWNTSYCSVKCQQEHWHKEHKRVCRRKR